ncbi:MAG: MiaB/RimO family radical SAM methylthiotransferase [Candidatus Omnitrophica bacterium]|nr:MiaB/RimO family radical SAM methylthiotransferase [Candidatus Omnitrophota bacterium]
MKVSFLPFGCKVNQYDTQLLRETLAQRGFHLAGLEEAELVVVNTCCVTRKAEKESLSAARRLLQRGKRVWLTGCLVRQEKESLQKRLPEAAIYERDFILLFAPGLNGKIFLEKVKNISYFANHVRAFVKVQEGCNNRCTYCLVPYVRGQSRSRQTSEILEEIKTLVANGYREIVLCGVDLGDYGRDNGSNFCQLAKQVLEIGIRVRFSSLEIFHISRRLLEVLKKSENFCPHFHLPLQSGSDRILRLMGRRYTTSDYLTAVHLTREYFPQVTFTTDCLVGFPGEKEEDFHLTEQIVKKVGFLKIHVFPYSRRPGTPAAMFPEQLPQTLIRERRRRLHNLATGVATKEKEKFLGTEQTVLVEKITGETAFGHTPGYLPVCFPNQGHQVNELVRVRLTGLSGDWLEGVLV